VRALLCLLPGLGDALVASPLIDGAANAGWELDVLAMLDPVADYARALPQVHEVVSFDLLAGQHNAIPVVARLRRDRYDVAILPFPAPRWQYHALVAACGSRRAIAHDYGGIARTIDRLAGVAMIRLRGGHRFSENARLATALGLAYDGARYVLPDAWRSPPRAGLLGVHPGSMKYKGNERRRWPLERFAQLIRMSSDKGRAVRLFVGPAERDEVAAIVALAGGQGVDVVDAPLGAAARALSECEVFVGNDAGFAHLASGLGVKTVTLYGMTDPVRSQPVGESIAVRPSSCPPCHDEGMRTFACVLDIGYRCSQEDLAVDDAMDAIDRAFAASALAFEPAESGDYRLYGRPVKIVPATSAIDSTAHSKAEASEIASGT